MKKIILGICFCFLLGIIKVEASWGWGYRYYDAGSIYAGTTFPQSVGRDINCSAKPVDIHKLKRGESASRNILKLIEVEKITNKDITYLSNARQIEKLNLAKNELLEAMKEIEENAFIDFVDIHLRAAWMYLGEIIGETSSESLLDELFSKFCLGK